MVRAVHGSMLQQHGDILEQTPQLAKGGVLQPKKQEKHTGGEREREKQLWSSLHNAPGPRKEGVCCGSCSW